MTRPEIGLISPCFIVSDAPRALAFYHDRLGFEITHQERDVLQVTAFEQPRDYGEHFKANYGPTIGIRGNAAKEGRAEQFDADLDAFCEEWNRGNGNGARFEMEYLLTVGTRV